MPQAAAGIEDVSAFDVSDWNSVTGVMVARVFVRNHRDVSNP
jgi:hypothetical protein